MTGKLSDRRQAQSTILVLAGNRVEFLDWLAGQEVYGERLRKRDTRPHRAFYAGRRDAMRGIVVDGILVVGSFWDRKDAVELHAFAQHGLRVPTS